MPATAPIKPKTALCWSAVWLLAALSVAGVLAVRRGPEEAVQFVTAYFVEFSLSLDNVAVIAMIFAYFRLAPEDQPRVLFWGILGAMVMRGIMIVSGLALISRFPWVLYLMGGFLVLTGIRWFFAKEDAAPERNRLLHWTRKLLPLSDCSPAGKFLTVQNGRRVLTPLAVVLLTVEIADLLFASDSIPAVFSITRSPFVVFTSNILAVASLRCIYFALAGALEYFRFLKSGLAAVLVFVGAKMLAAPRWTVSTGLSLLIIAGIFAFSIALSVLVVRKERAQ